MAKSEAKKQMKSYLESQIAAVYSVYSHKRKAKGGLFVVKPNSETTVHLRYFAGNNVVGEYSEEVKANTEANIHSAAVVVYGEPFLREDKHSKSKFDFKTSEFTRELSDLFGSINFLNLETKVITPSELESRTRNYGSPCNGRECYERLARDIPEAKNAIPLLKKDIEYFNERLDEERKKTNPDPDMIGYFTASIKGHNNLSAVFSESLEYNPEGYKDPSGFTWLQENGAQLCMRRSCSKNDEDVVQRTMLARGRIPVRGKAVRLKELKHIFSVTDVSDFKLNLTKHNGLYVARIVKRKKGHFQTELF